MKRYSTLWFICALCLHITLAQSPFEPAQVVYRCDPQEYIVSTSDIEGDQDIDIIVAISNFGSLFWYENLGDGSMSARKAIHQGQENITALTSGLLDQDQDADVLFATASPSAIQVLRNNGGGASFSPTQEIGVSGTVHSLIMVDLDGDQDNDLVWTTSANGTIAAAFNDGGIIGAPVVLWELEGARHLRAADMDGDGDMDMICSSSVSGDISVLLNDGGGLFDTWMDIGASVADPWWFDVADLRADGDPDIIAPGGGITWFDNQSGTAGFVPRTVYPPMLRNRII